MSRVSFDQSYVEFLLKDIAAKDARIAELERSRDYQKTRVAKARTALNRNAEGVTFWKERAEGLERTIAEARRERGEARLAAESRITTLEGERAFWKDETRKLERTIADAQAAPDAVTAASRAFMKDGGGNHMAAALLAANLHSVARVAELEAALTPSAETKEAYMSEFKFDYDAVDENGDSLAVSIAVPWTTIKEIMGAIRARAALQPKAKTEP